jgi:phospholipid/cholesterol/gamma-HCH transport system substrate-binding protein
VSGETNYLKLGIFVLGGAAIIVIVFVLLLAGRIFRMEVMLETYFQDSVYGLEAGSEVVYRGVPVGEVNSISFTAVRYEQNKPLDSRKPYVLVRFGVYPSFFGGLPADQVRGLIRTWVGRGLCVQTEPKGLTGLSYLNMNFAQEPGSIPKLQYDWTPEYPYVPATPNVFGKVTDTIKSVRATLDQVQQLNIPQLGKDLEGLLSSARQQVEQAQIGALATEAHGALADIRRSTDQLNALLANPYLARTIDDASATARAGRHMAEAGEKQVPEILENVRQATGALREGSANLPQTLQDLNRGLRALSALLDQQQQTIAETLQNLRAASESIRELSEKANQYPAGTLFGEPPAPVHPGGDQ